MILASILDPLENVLRDVLEWLHGTVGLPWAWAIVALTVIVRILLVPLTVKQIHSMQELQRHAPQMKEIQRKYKHDRQKMNEEMMRFYRENRVNPMASCLPLLAQFPVFISLYFVLRDFAKSHPGGDLSWLGFVPDIAKNASSHWSGFVLLAVYVASQVSSTWFMSSAMQSKAQRNLMLALPFLFVFVVVNFPTGLVLYWMTTNLWTVGQGLITRRLVPKTPAPAMQKRSSRTPPKGAEDGRPPAEAAKPAAEAAKPAGPQQPRKVRRKKKKARR